MKIKIVVFLVICAFGASLSAASARQQTVLGVYKNDLTEYSAEGRKLGVLPNVTDDEINGTVVLATSPRKLVHVSFRGKEIWLRASSLKLALPILPKCPKAAPGNAPDRTTPAASGMGANCE